MIPERITLKNFGGVKDLSVDLSQVNFASVGGQNGAGKSTTFTWAPLWALFGSGRNASPNDIVRVGGGIGLGRVRFPRRGPDVQGFAGAVAEGDAGKALWSFRSLESRGHGKAFREPP